MMGPESQDTISHFPQTWSLVALIYNNWIFYLPTAAEIEAEFELEPVMCTTTRNIGD